MPPATAGLGAISANDHFFFSDPVAGRTRPRWPRAIERSGEMTLATTVSLSALAGSGSARQDADCARHPASGWAPDRRGRAGLVPGTTTTAMGISFEERWRRFDEARGRRCERCSRESRCRGSCATTPCPPDSGARARSRPGRMGSRCGSAAGARTPASPGSRGSADGWLASAYNTTPERFADARDRSERSSRIAAATRTAFPNALATMWTWVSRGPGGGRARARRRAGAAAEARPRRAARDRSASARRALRRAPLALRRGRLPARLPLAARRRAATSSSWSRTGCCRWCPPRCSTASRSLLGLLENNSFARVPDHLFSFARFLAHRERREREDEVALSELAEHPLALPAGVELQWLGTAGYRLTFEGQDVVHRPLRLAGGRCATSRTGASPALADPAMQDTLANRVREGPGRRRARRAHPLGPRHRRAAAVPAGRSHGATARRRLRILMRLYGLGEQAVEVVPRLRPTSLARSTVRFHPSLRSKLLLGLKVPFDGEVTCDHVD